MESITTGDGFTVTSDESLEDMQVALAIEPTEKADESLLDRVVDAAIEDRTGKPAEKIDKRTREGRKASIQSEIDELTTAKHTTKRELEEATAQLAALRAEMAALRQAPAPREEAKPAAPQTFPSYQEMLAKQPDLTPEQWLDQRDEWRDARKAEADARRAAEASHQTRAESFNAKVTKAEESEPGFWASVKPFADRLVPAYALPKGVAATGANAIADVILDSDLSDKLLRHFRDNPADFQRISTLHPVQAFRAMGKLEDRLEAASSTGPAPKAPIISQAKAPLKPVSASPVISDDGVPEEDLPFEEFMKKGNARQYGRSH